MKFGNFPLDRCKGAILAHSVALGGRRLAKGATLTAGDLCAAAAAGHERLTVAIPGAGDVREDEACSRIGTALAGQGLKLSPPAQGRIDLLSAGDGLLELPERAVHGVNRVNEGVGLATLPAWTKVRADEVVATLKIIPFALREAAVFRAERAAARQPLFCHAFRPLTVRLLQTRTATVTEKMLAKTERVTRERVEALRGRFHDAGSCAHNTEGLSGALQGAAEDILLVSGASATTDRRDVIPSAIRAIGGRIERLGMPVDPGNLLLLGYRGAQVIVGMPGCARSPKRNGFDFVLERLFAGLGVSSADIAKMGLGGLLQGAERPDR